MVLEVGGEVQFWKGHMESGHKNLRKAYLKLYLWNAPFSVLCKLGY
jgi:hypothetical protein